MNDLTAAFSGGAAGLHATREVVAGKDDLEVVSNEGAHVAIARHIELSDCKDTKKARETSEIVGSGGQHRCQERSRRKKTLCLSIHGHGGVQVRVPAVPGSDG